MDTSEFIELYVLLLHFVHNIGTSLRHAQHYPIGVRVVLIFAPQTNKLGDIVGFSNFAKTNCY